MIPLTLDGLLMLDRSPHRTPDGARARCVGSAEAGVGRAAVWRHHVRDLDEAGFITSAVENGASVFRTMDVSLHRRVETLRGYVRRAEEFKDHAGDGLL